MYGFSGYLPLKHPLSFQRLHNILPSLFLISSACFSWHTPAHFALLVANCDAKEPRPRTGRSFRREYS